MDVNGCIFLGKRSEEQEKQCVVLEIQSNASHEGDTMSPPDACKLPLTLSQTVQYIMSLTAQEMELQEVIRNIRITVIKAMMRSLRYSALHNATMISLHGSM